MKKFLLILTLIMPFIGGCKKEEENPFKQQIVGQWTLRSTDLGTISHPTYEQYSFDSEGNFQYLRLVLEATTNKVLGYQYKKAGKYRIEGDEIDFYDTTTYTNDFSKGEYSSENKLIQTTDERTRAGIAINNNVLTIDFPCLPNVDCIGMFSYQRQLKE